MLLESERSEQDTIRGNKWKSEIYIHIWYMQDTLVAGLVVCNVGGVKCQPFLKSSNYW